MSVRVRGMLIAIAGAVATVAVYLLLLSLGWKRVPYAAALPLVGVFWGLIELISGVRLPELEKKWSTLSKWTRQGLGCLVILAALGLFVLVIRIL